MHVTDLTNASRTMLLDLDTLDWSPELLDLFGVDPALLPPARPLLGGRRRGRTARRHAPDRGDRGRPAGLPVRPRLLRTAARPRRRTARAASCSRNAGAERGPAPAGLLETVAASGGYAFEGAILASGAAIQWLRDGLGILADAAESERLALSVESTGGVSFVPAFAGLGSPHWNAEARGLISGITRGTTRAQLVRAALEGIAFQVADVLDLLPGGVEVLRADGGATANGFLMQFQADLLGCPVEVAAEQETTALGAAALAGRAVGLWPDDDAIRRLLRPGAVYEPAADRGRRRGPARRVALSARARAPLDAGLFIGVRGWTVAAGTTRLDDGGASSRRGRPRKWVVAGSEATVAVVDERWRLDAADLRRVPAAGMEPASARRVDRAWHLALEDDALAARSLVPLVRFDHRDRRQQSLGVGMDRTRVEVVDGGDLDDDAEVHHGDAVGDVADDPEVVRDEDIGEVEVLLQVVEQVDDLCLDRDVKRRDGLVGDDQLRVQGERAGDADPLALATGELVRVPVQVAAESPTTSSSSCTCLPHLRTRADPVDAERIADDLHDPLAGIQRGVGVLEDHLHLLPVGAGCRCARAM